jgi:hypothetical protein
MANLRTQFGQFAGLETAIAFHWDISLLLTETEHGSHASLALCFAISFVCAIGVGRRRHGRCTKIKRTCLLLLFCVHSQSNLCIPSAGHIIRGSSLCVCVATVCCSASPFFPPACCALPLRVSSSAHNVRPHSFPPLLATEEARQPVVVQSVPRRCAHELCVGFVWLVCASGTCIFLL